MGNRDRAHVGFLRWFVWHLLRWSWWPISAALFRPRIHGVEHLPDTGYLLLANHTAAIDTLWVAAPTARTVHFMTSAARFRSPAMGRALRFFNCFPKTVGSRDPNATRAVKELLDAGQVVQIMPEGTRTWDGRLNPIRPSIGALVKRYQAPVVLCRVETGHLLWPRWARFPRWVPLKITYDPVRTWESDADTIWKQIVTGLTLPPSTLDGLIVAHRCAEGLPTYLWACPNCFAFATEATGHDFRCTSCNSSWTLTVDLHLIGSTRHTVATAWDCIEAHFGDPPRCTPNQILAGEVEMSQFDTGDNLFEGRVEIDSLGLNGPDGWRLDFNAIKNVYMDAGNVLVFRQHNGDQLRLAPRNQSTWMWFHFVSRHLSHHRSSPPA